MIKDSKHKKGFTLVEIMVAVSIFVIVAFIVTSSLLAILDASRRANKIRLIIDNMNFALDSMTTKLKFGTDYETDGSSLSFTDREEHTLAYCLSNVKIKRKGVSEPVNNQSILKCDFGKNRPVGTCGDNSSCESIVTDEITVTDLRFAESLCDGSRCPNREIVILVKAETMIKNSLTKLNFQTAVSQSISQ